MNGYLCFLVDLKKFFVFTQVSVKAATFYPDVPDGLKGDWTNLLSRMFIRGAVSFYCQLRK